MKNWDCNSDDARCSGQDRDVSGLLVNGAGLGDQDLIHIAERRRVGNSRKRNISGASESSAGRSEGTRGRSKHKGKVWRVDGDQFIPPAAQPYQAGFIFLRW